MKIPCKYENVTASINKRNGVWNLMIRESGKQKSRCTKESNQRKAVAKAKQMLAERYGDNVDDTITESTNQSAELRTVADLMQRYFSGTYMSNQQVHTPDKIKKHVSAENARINNLCDFFKSTLIDQVNKSHINKYITHRRKHVADGTIQIELNALFAAARSDLTGSRRNNMKQNCKGHWSLSESIKNSRRKKAMNYQEFDAIHEKLQEYDDKHHSNFALFVEILRESGIRWGQLSELRFSMIDFAEHSLTFTRENMKTKNKSIHKVIVDEELITKLYRLHEKNENAEHKREFVFCSTVNQNRIFSRTTFYNAFYGAQDALGYTDKDGKGKDVYKFRPHDLKRTFIMESLDFGYDRSEIKIMTNNTSDMIFDGYVNNRRIKKLVSKRRATRQAIIDESNQEVERLKTNILESEDGVWSLEKLDELEKAIEEKKARMLEKEELEDIAGEVADIEI